MRNDLIKNNRLRYDLPVGGMWLFIIAVLIFLSSCRTGYAVYHLNGSFGDDSGDCTIEHCRKHNNWFTRCTYDFTKVEKSEAEEWLKCGEWKVDVYNQCKCK